MSKKAEEVIFAISFLVFVFPGLFGMMFRQLFSSSPVFQERGGIVHDPIYLCLLAWMVIGLLLYWIADFIKSKRLREEFRQEKENPGNSITDKN